MHRSGVSRCLNIEAAFGGATVDSHTSRRCAWFACNNVRLPLKWQAGPFIEVLYKIQERRFDLPSSVEGLDDFWPAAKPIDLETLSNADMASAPSPMAQETTPVTPGPDTDESWMAEVARHGHAVKTLC